jgi:hypothetical protein
MSAADILSPEVLAQIAARVEAAGPCPEPDHCVWCGDLLPGDGRCDSSGVACEGPTCADARGWDRAALLAHAVDLSAQLAIMTRERDLALACRADGWEAAEAYERAIVVVNRERDEALAQLTALAATHRLELAALRDEVARLRTSLGTGCDEP